MNAYRKNLVDIQRDSSVIDSQFHLEIQVIQDSEQNQEHEWSASPVHSAE